jgi:hypothetical protein
MEEGASAVTLLLYNGTIHTLNPQQPAAEALVTRGGRVLAVGSLDDVRAAAGPRAESIDLAGRAVIPGLTDAHVHIGWYGLTRRQVRLSGTHSLHEAQERIAEGAQKLAPGAWLQGGGWNHSEWGSAWPSRADLDRVCPDNPAFLVRKDGHSAWVNSRALALAAIDSGTPDPPGGQIQRDQQGEPTGILIETAQDIMRSIIVPPGQEERLGALQEALREALGYGLTSLHVPPFPPESDSGREMLTDLQLLYGRGGLYVRCLAHLQERDLDAALALGIRSGLGDHWLRIGGLKIFADGSLGSQSAELLEPYEGSQQRGLPTMPVEELEGMIQHASSGGIAVTVHAIGDAANRKVLNAIEKARSSAGPLALPNRIEHVQLIQPEDMPRLAALNVIASMQPLHATSDMHMADRLWGARCALAYANRSVQQAGAVLAFGSDAPVEPLNPWLGIHAAVTRQRPDNTPEGGWHPEQRLSLADTLRGFCIGPAVASAEEGEKGMLAPGMLADMAVLAADPFEMLPAQLHRMQVDMTIVEGQVRWER